MGEGTTNPEEVVSVHWFRRGLRVHDNAALLEACVNCDHLIPLYVLDTTNTRTSARKKEFLLASLRDLDQTLRERYNSRLFFARGDPRVVVPAFVKKWGASKVTFEKVTEPHYQARDTMIITKLDQMGVTVKTFTLNTLYEMTTLGDICNRTPPLIFKDFVKLLQQAGPVELPVQPPKCIPPPVKGIEKTIDDEPSTSMWLGNIPTLTSLGVKPPPSSNTFIGGEGAALRRLERILDRENWIKSSNGKAKLSSNPFVPSSTVLSPYLNLGCLSVRKFYKDVTVMLSKTGGNKKPPVSLEGQLLWREFYYLVGTYTPNFDKMKGNRICKQIPWRSKEADDMFEEHLLAWREGQTGYPFIDAIMTQLKETGWIHHLARHAAACFLTRGDLWISWEEGAAIFEQLLLDGDWSLNTGNWLWLSASCFFYQYFRVYSPVLFGKMTDKTGEYVRQWLPVLRNMPAEYIYEPWKAPIEVQVNAGCVVGQDYPERLVDHETAKEQNVEKMRIAYKQNECRENIDDTLVGRSSGTSGITSSDSGESPAESSGSPPEASSSYGSGDDSGNTSKKTNASSPRNLAIKRKRN